VKFELPDHHDDESVKPYREEILGIAFKFLLSSGALSCKSMQNNTFRDRIFDQRVNPKTANCENRLATMLLGI
jgi:hypothetical protein